MSESKLKFTKVMNLNLNEDRSSEKISDLLMQLKKQGFEEIRITIEGSSNNLLKNAGFNIKLFERIKNTQDLPDWVVYDLIESSGKLKGTHFDGRLKNAD
jgi:hypothetical protein